MGGGLITGSINIGRVYPLEGLVHEVLQADVVLEGYYSLVILYFLLHVDLPLLFRSKDPKLLWHF